MKLKLDWKKFLLAMLVRAVRTFAQAFIAAAGVEGATATFSEIDWLRALSVSGVAFVLSILMSLATGLPEVELEPAVLEPPDEEEK